jgi:hypothetical protein
VTDVVHVEGGRAAAEYLRQLLLKPGRYREAWQQYVARPRDGVINQMAVAEVIAGRLRAAPSHAGDAQMMPYQLRETESGALSGLQFGTYTMQLFIDAFGFSEHEAGRLWRLWNGSATISVLAGSHAVTVQTQREIAKVLGPPRHQTLSLHDHVYVGEDGRLDRLRMLQVIEAISQGVDRIPYLCDTNVLTVEVGQGGKELAGNVQQIRDDMFFTEILLARTLDLGETITLEYWVTYRYPGDPADPAEREYRRAVMRHAENLDMRVEFHPNRPPAQVWWAHWDGDRGNLIQREAVMLDSERSVHRYVRSVDKTVVGFYWQWEQAHGPTSHELQDRRCESRRESRP